MTLIELVTACVAFNREPLAAESVAELRRPTSAECRQARIDWLHVVEALAGDAGDDDLSDDVRDLLDDLKG